jgi:preprotein translocase subunit SecG
METIHTFLLVLQALVSIALIGFILIQHGKGADAGAAFGSGASSTVFGSRGSGNFLTKSTTVLAIIFLSNSLLLGYLASHSVTQQGSLLDDEPAIVHEQSNMAGGKATETPADLPQDVTEAPASDIPAIPDK